MPTAMSNWKLISNILNNAGLTQELNHARIPEIHHRFLTSGRELALTGFQEQ
jgi:hypothetical protein